MQTTEWLNYHHLYYFWSIARMGSLSQAAESLRLSPSTLSKQIGSLEEFLGGALFLRNGRALSLTMLGREVLSYAEKIFQTGNALLEMARRQPPRSRRPLRLGIASGIPKEIVDVLLSPVMSETEAEGIFVQQDSMRPLLDELTAGRLHAVLSNRAPQRRDGANLFVRMIEESQVSLYGAPHLAKRYAAGFPRSLEEAPVLLPAADTHLRTKLDDFFLKHGLSVQPAGEFDDLALMLSFGMDGLGLFPLLSIQAARLDKSSPVRLIGELPGVSEQFYVILAERRVRHPALRGLLDRSSAVARSRSGPAATS